MGLLEEAAICMLAMSKEPPCFDDAIKEELCIMMCCCIKYPILNSKRLMQNCANLLMDATNSVKKGYENSVPYSMDTKKPLPVDPQTGRRIWREVKQWARDDTTDKTGKVRIPDVTVYDKQGNPDYFYEMKFPGDRWRDDQYTDYVKLRNGDDSKVRELREEECKCKGRTEDRKKLTSKEIDDISKQVTQYFIADWEANKDTIAGVMAGYQDQELAELIPDIYSAVHHAKTFGEKMAPLKDPTLFIPWGKLGSFGRLGGAAGGRVPGPILPSPGWNFIPIPVK